MKEEAILCASPVRAFDFGEGTTETQTQQNHHSPAITGFGCGFLCIFIIINAVLTQTGSTRGRASCSSAKGAPKPPQQSLAPAFAAPGARSANKAGTLRPPGLRPRRGSPGCGGGLAPPPAPRRAPPPGPLPSPVMAMGLDSPRP